MNTIVVTFDRPAPLLSLNDRLHWAARHRRTSLWRDASYTHAKAANVATQISNRRCLVTATFHFGRGARRDPSNYIATVKPIVDGLVDAGVWPDDHGAYVVTAEPILVVNKTTPQQVIISLEPFPSP